MQFVGVVQNIQANELRDTVMSRLLEVADLCSRTVSDPANRLRKTREKKSSAVLLFGAVTCRQSAPDPPRERGDSQEGGNRSFSKAVSLQLYEKFKGRTKV